MLKEGCVTDSTRDFHFCGERKCWTKHCSVVALGSNGALRVFPKELPMGR